MGKRPEVPKSKPNPFSQGNIFDFEKNLKAIIDLGNIQNSQHRGFAFEKFLFRFFQENSLDPRGSFKITGEQIDGSFDFLNEIYLLEAKWTLEKVDKATLAIFYDKVATKSGFTRGLFISFSGYSDQALASFSAGRKARIVLMTVEEIAILLTKKIDFRHLLRKKVRALAEEGAFYKHIVDLGL